MGITRAVRVTLVANPGSGGESDPDALAAALTDRGAEVRLRRIDELAVGGDGSACDPREGAERIAEDAPERVVVAGGDGSIALAAHAAAHAGVPLAVVPTGTANDFARALDLPPDHDAALALAADPAARTRRIDLLYADRRPFVNVASAGLSVVAAQEARPFKRALGALAYGVGAMRAGLSAQPLACRAAIDGRERFAGAVWQVIVSGTGAFGGGSEVGAADDDDGLVDLTAVRAGPRARLLLRAFGMRSGRITGQRGVFHARGREVVLDVPAGTTFNVDGEVCGCGEPARFTIRPAAVEVVVG